MGELSGRFYIYQHVFVAEGHARIVRPFIVWRDKYGVYTFTDFHKYCVNPKRRVVRLTQTSPARYKFVCAFLNYCFIYRNVRKLDEITADMVKDYLRLYGQCDLPWDDDTTHRARETVERCAAYIFDFCDVLKYNRKNRSKLNITNLYREVDRRDKRGRIVPIKVPDFEINYTESGRTPIYRDMPDKAFNLLLHEIATKHKALLGLIMLSAFAGLRPSEACNVRRAGSPLGDGILISEVDGHVTSIEIDIQKELMLRSDRVSVGAIKKGRIQRVPDIFQNAFLSAYKIYTEYLSFRPYEKDYMPFSVNKNGKAITYPSYSGWFQDFIQKEMIPIYLASDDPEVVNYGHILETRRISPHIFRHWYTVQLVLSGVNDPGTLMSMRGDKSPESALVYLRGKGELEKKYRKISNELFDYRKWMADKLYGNK